ncbi:hypothetical protein AGABI2DRAFT_193032 [Agaricus bisporus var. bisporus H97]|uniref:hypothetical protein n=1 Tax=Agaricus bisporus var. bisporus (strain H97 / ATCC MYA-4626 / FGSC 10389) TaxID=936046 RepID=UPI00029F58A9|nr:hypothetical protein AGABI2DRAFT_193032 [Agaricus bisporus var. bisporus H97]EKV46272.1 hypothetical protein AGABI2DRAFT_193032 [Agaricus bisporus var. bisporus H97]
MFARTISTIIAILFFAMLAAASVVPRTDRVPPVDCAAGGIYCCISVVGGSDHAVRLIAELLGLAWGPGIKGLVGLTCSPIIEAGPGGGNFCSQQTVCCTGDNFSGLIVIDCSPINVNV